MGVPELIAAVQKGDINEVKSLIGKGVNINVFTSGRTPLGIAAHQGNIPMLELLLNCGKYKNVETPLKNNSNKNEKRDVGITVRKRKAVEGNNGYFEVIHDEKNEESESDINQNVSIDEVETPDGMDNLEWDIELNDDDSVYEDDWSNQYRWYAKILANSCLVSSDLPHNCDVNLQDSVGRTALHYAAESGHINAVKVLLNAGCKADIGDVDSLTPLHFAANGGYLCIVENLLSYGCNVNAKSTDKLSPLHYAATKGHKEVVHSLLASGANVDSLDENERTPLMLAVSRQYLDVAQVLVDHGAKVNIEDVKGYTAMCEAVWHKSVSLVKLLLDGGAKIVPTHYLVHYSVLHGDKEMVQTLLEAGALVNIRDSRGDSPLIIAAKTPHLEIVQLLLSHGAVVDLGGYYDTTALFSAVKSARRECPRVLRVLVEAGADIEREMWGQTPLAHALIAHRIRVAVSLITLGAKLLPSHYPYLLNNDSIAIYKALVFAGNDVLDLFPNLEPPVKWPIKITRGQDWLIHAKFNPHSLAELCRIVVRSQAVGTVSLWISSLCVPPIITRYLMLEDVLESIEFSKSVDPH